MSIENLHTYLVYPNRGLAEPHKIGGAGVPLIGQVFDLLKDVYSKAEKECSIDISFSPAGDGNAENECRTLLLNYAKAPSIEAGLPLAERLGLFSTKRSALGLLFLATGMVGTQRKVVIARFAANSGILADESGIALSVQFVERVFLRNVKSYKAVLYQDAVTDKGFWQGKAVDKQIRDRETEVSGYWINEFLASDFRTTSAQGTKVLAVAMKKATKSTSDLSVKKELTAAATLGANLDGEVLTADEFIGRMALSPAAREAIVGEMKHHDLANEQFRFSAEEFNRQLAYKTVELDTGGLLTAPMSDFDEVFPHDEPDENGNVTYTAAGRVVSEKLDKVVR